MPKAGGLTGGTGDVNPQWYRLITPTVSQTTAASAGISTQATFPLPVVRKGQLAGKVTVVELLKVRWGNQLGFATNIQQNAIYTLSAYLSTKAPQPTGAGLAPFSSLSDPSIVDFVSVTTAIGVSVAINLLAFSSDNETPNFHDLTDGAGHGILIATDNIYLSMQLLSSSIDGGSYTATGISNAALLYRFKDVTLTEYIGIVQSQQ